MADDSIDEKQRKKLDKKAEKLSSFDAFKLQAWTYLSIDDIASIEKIEYVFLLTVVTHRHIFLRESRVWLTNAA